MKYKYIEIIDKDNHVTKRWDWTGKRGRAIGYEVIRIQNTLTEGFMAKLNDTSEEQLRCF